jgi:hypothetical protein
MYEGMNVCLFVLVNVVCAGVRCFISAGNFASEMNVKLEIASADCT